MYCVAEAKIEPLKRSDKKKVLSSPKEMKTK